MRIFVKTDPQGAMLGSIRIDGHSLSVEDVVSVARSRREEEWATVEVTDAARIAVEKSRAAIDALVQEGRTVYGVNTGYGALRDRAIPSHELRRLQRNLLLSHAVGVGDPLPEEVVRATMLIRANSLAKGYSGIRLQVLQTLVNMLNRGVHPVIPAKGSVSASGDLAPLAHLALVLIGEGEAIWQEQRLPGAEALRRAGLRPLELEAKEGLALINGTAPLAAWGALTVHDATRLARTADIAGTMSLEATAGLLTAFDERIQAVRPHPGQGQVAANVRRLAAGSDLTWDPRRSGKVQDPYCLRCIPQVHGAVRDALRYVEGVVAIELNSAVDNPLIFPEHEQVALSGGNFHGQPLAHALDFLGLSVTALGTISERRLARLVAGEALGSSLPLSLIQDGGLNSGFLIVQYTAAALVSENKVLAHPASVDTIPTSAEFEDHVSMGDAAARKADQIVRNLETVLALEVLAAAQAIELRLEQGYGRPGRGSLAAYRLVREVVPFLRQDTVMYPLIGAVQELVSTGALVRAVEAALEEPLG